MIRPVSIPYLCQIINIPPANLRKVSRNPLIHYYGIEIERPGKDPRRVFCPDKQMRYIQDRLLHRVFLPIFLPLKSSHGGIKGRSILTNLAPHVGNEFVYTADIEAFFPSVKSDDVHRLLCCELGWSEDAARLCTALCTLEGHLAQGLLTSPILADRFIRRVDRRIFGVCNQHGLEYTRFVDDLTISGRFNILGTGIEKLIRNIVTSDGLSIHKVRSGSMKKKENTITKVSLRNGRPDVTRHYFDTLVCHLTSMASLAKGCDFDGPYLTRDQLLGKVHFVCWVNPHRGYVLKKLYRLIDWKAADQEARRRSLVRIVKPRGKKFDLTEREETLPRADPSQQDCQPSG